MDLNIITILGMTLQGITPTFYKIHTLQFFNIICTPTEHDLGLPGGIKTILTKEPEGMDRVPSLTGKSLEPRRKWFQPQVLTRARCNMTFSQQVYIRITVRYAF